MLWLISSVSDRNASLPGTIQSGSQCQHVFIVRCTSQLFGAGNSSADKSTYGVGLQRRSAVPCTSNCNTVTESHCCQLEAVRGPARPPVLHKSVQKAPN